MRLKTYIETCLHTKTVENQHRRLDLRYLNSDHRRVITAPEIEYMYQKLKRILQKHAEPINFWKFLFNLSETQASM